MRNTLGGLLLAGSIVLCGACFITGAQAADVIRIGVATADSKADYDSNAALTPKALELLKKAKGVKEVYSLTNPKDMTVATVSIWDSEADLTATMDSAEWKA